MPRRGPRRAAPRAARRRRRGGRRPAPRGGPRRCRRPALRRSGAAPCNRPERPSGPAASPARYAGRPLDAPARGGSVGSQVAWDPMKTFGERLNGLRWRLAATRRLWSAGAQPNMPFLPPAPPEPTDCQGKIDEPEPNAVLERGMIDVRGWSFFVSGPTARIELRLGETSLGRARVGIPRPDIRDGLDDQWGAAAGFDASVDIEDWPEEDGPTELHAVAISAAGDRHELGPVPVEVVGARPAGRGAKRSRSRHRRRRRRWRPDREGRRLLVFTHQLDLGGAQLYLLELIGALLESRSRQPDRGQRRRRGDPRAPRSARRPRPHRRAAVDRRPQRPHRPARGAGRLVGRAGLRGGADQHRDAVRLSRRRAGGAAGDPGAVVDPRERQAAGDVVPHAPRRAPPRRGGAGERYAGAVRRRADPAPLRRRRAARSAV